MYHVFISFEVVIHNYQTFIFHLDFFRCFTEKELPMRLNPIHILIFIVITIPCLQGQNYTIKNLEKRVKLLEKKVSVLERKSIDLFMESKWHGLKKNMKKKDVQSKLGLPDRIGKFAHGGEIWGFSNATLKFDRNGSLEYWSKPLRN